MGGVQQVTQERNMMNEKRSRKRSKSPRLKQSARTKSKELATLSTPDNDLDSSFETSSNVSCVSVPILKTLGKNFINYYRPRSSDISSKEDNLEEIGTEKNIIDYGSPRSFNTSCRVSIVGSESDMSSTFGEKKFNFIKVFDPNSDSEAVKDVPSSDNDIGRPDLRDWSDSERNLFEHNQNHHQSNTSIDTIEANQASVLSAITSIMDSAAQSYRPYRSRSPSPRVNRSISPSKSYENYCKMGNRDASPRRRVMERMSSNSDMQRLAPLTPSAPSNNIFSIFMPKGKLDILKENIMKKNWPEIITFLTTESQNKEDEDSFAKSNFPVLGLACSMNAPFEVIKLILLNQPDSATFHDEKLNFPLHHICQSGTSIKALRFVLSQFPNAVSRRNAIGKTPLFIAVERGVPSKWCEILIDVAPEVSGYADNFGVFPLHNCAKNYNDISFFRKLIDSYPVAVRKLDRQGAPPLYYAVTSDSSYEIVSLLLSYCPIMAKAKVAESTCIEWIWMLHQSIPEGGEVRRVESHDIEVELPNSIDEVPHKPKTRKEECWCTLELLLKAAYHNSVSSTLTDDKHWRVVHAAAAFGCPRALLESAISQHPDQVHRPDENGRYPLHLAAASQVTLGKDDGSSIDLLVTVYPEAARLSDRYGKLPIQYALESGRTWSKGVFGILEAYPDAICITDPKTSFYPFMIGAKLNDNKTKIVNSELFEYSVRDDIGKNIWNSLSYPRKKAIVEQRKENEEKDTLETVYQLIRRAPQLVACGVKNQPDDMITVNLRLKNMELRRKKKSLRRALARMCLDFDRINTNHTLRTSELELEIARLTQKLSVLRILDPVISTSSTDQLTSDLVSSADEYSESQGYAPRKSTLKKVKDPSKKYRRIKVSFA